VENGKDDRPVPTSLPDPARASHAAVSVCPTRDRRTFRRGQTPLWVVLILVAGVLVVLGWWTYYETSGRTPDGRQEIVAWGITFFGEDVYALVHEFERRNPQYKVIISSSAERDSNSDAQRLLSAIAGGVPPDVVFFARHTTGEWASRSALLDLIPLLEAQDPDDPYRINLDEYYDWALAEASYESPATTADGPPTTGRRLSQKGVYGIPTTGDIRVLYLHSDSLRQAGLVDEHGNPKPPRTWNELREYTRKLTVFREPGNNKSGIRRLGFAPNFGNAWLFLYAWQAGGELLSPDGTRVTMDAPPVVRALRYMTDLYDDVGGAMQVNIFQQNLAGESLGGGFRPNMLATELDPFVRGSVVMKIDNDYALRTIAEGKPNLDFVIAPAPLPADQVALGRQPVTWAGGFSLVIPRTSKNPDGAFKLIQFLTSWEAIKRLEQGTRERRESEGRIYLPSGQANKVYFERLVKDAIFDNPHVPPAFKRAYAVLQDLMPNTKFRPVTPVGQRLWDQQVRAIEAAINHQFADEARSLGVDEIEHVLKKMQAPVQQQLDEVLRPPPPHVVNWTPYLILYALALAVPLVAMWVVYERRRRSHGYRGHELGAAMLFMSPWVVGFAVLVGGPILFSILISFTRWDVLNEARYVGWENYRGLFSDGVFYKSIANTAFMLIRIPLMMAISLCIALLLNRSIRAIGTYRTSFYMPAIVPVVASSLLWVWLLNPSAGAINSGLRAVGLPEPLWLQDPAWSKPALILMSVWTAGAGMIIWLAGLQSIPPQLYEAASIDGAGRWRRFLHVTIPMLSPYILFNTIIGVIAAMQIFAEAYVMTAGGPADSTLFYAYYLFKQAFQYFRMGYASALAWILFLIVFVLTALQLWSSKRWVHYEQA
jgi:multiple sugar transport system permease protein